MSNNENLSSLLAREEVVLEATKIFDALSDTTRFVILGELAQGPKSVSDLLEVVKVSQSAVSHQLRLLRDRGLVSVERQGKHAIYSVADDHVTQLLLVGLQHAAEPEHLD